MTIGLTAAIDTLVLVLPGFVALKIFYLGGIRTRRSDIEWFIWSLLASVPLAALSVLVRDGLSRMFPEELAWTGLGAGTADTPRIGLDALFVAIQFGLAFAVGGGLVALWRRAIVRRWPSLQSGARLQAWDTALGTGGWVTVFTKEGRAVFGYLGEIADSAQTDRLDLFVKCPAWYDIGSGELTSLEPAQGIYIAHDEVAYIQKFPGDEEPSVWDDQHGRAARAKYESAPPPIPSRLDLVREALSLARDATRPSRDG
jgi:hypothetical protein